MNVSYAEGAEPVARQPNLLFVMTDQQRFDALGANGNRILQTPRLDALAGAGANLRSYFANAPVCVPSRCSLFTGRYPHAHRCRENYNLLEAGREMHLFRVLKQAGYRLGYCGKNHLLDAQEFSNFDFVEYVSELGHKPGAQEARLSARYHDNLRTLPVSEIWRAGLIHDEPPQATSAWQTAEAGCHFLEQQSGDEPFALCVSFEDPHVPHLALREYFEK